MAGVTNQCKQCKATIYDEQTVSMLCDDCYPRKATEWGASTMLSEFIIRLEELTDGRWNWTILDDRNYKILAVGIGYHTSQTAYEQAREKQKELHDEF